MILLDSECSTMITKPSRNTYVRFYPVIYAVIRLFSIVLLNFISGKITGIQDLWGINQRISLSLGVLSSAFAVVSIIEVHKELYTVLKYEKYFSIIISLTLGIFSEIIWVSVLSGNNLFYFHGMRSLPLYFVNFSMFAYTSLILLIEYKYKACPKSDSTVLKYKLSACIGISVQILIFSALYYCFGFDSLLTIATEYLLVATSLFYFLTFYYDLRGTTFFDTKEKECEQLYTTTF